MWTKWHHSLTRRDGTSKWSWRVSMKPLFGRWTPVTPMQRRQDPIMKFTRTRNFRLPNSAILRCCQVSYVWAPWQRRACQQINFRKWSDKWCGLICSMELETQESGLLEKAMSPSAILPLDSQRVECKASSKRCQVDLRRPMEAVFNCLRRMNHRHLSISHVSWSCLALCNQDACVRCSPSTFYWAYRCNSSQGRLKELTNLQLSKTRPISHSLRYRYCYTSCHSHNEILVHAW